MSLKRAIGRILKAILPYKLYKLVANGIILVPKYYSGIIADAERYRDLSFEGSEDKDIILVRKFGHILDKGLHRPDAVPGHSKSIYQELNALLKKLENTKYKSDPTYIWAMSKIKKYELLQNDTNNFQPFVGAHPDKLNITFEDVERLIKSRRSNRSFKDKRLNQDDILKLKEMANWAASSCNKQPIKIYVAENPAHAQKCLSCCKGGTGFSNYIPSFWAFTVNCTGYVWPSEMYLPTLDCSLGAQNLFLAAETLGLSGTILSWAQKDEEEEAKLRNYLNIPQQQIIIFCAVIGYADQQFVTPARKDNSI